MDSLKKRIDELQAEVKKAIEKIGLAALEVEQKDLQEQMQKPDFWQDSSKAQTASKREADLSRRISPWQKLQQEISELAELAASDDASMEKELESQLSAFSFQLSRTPFIRVMAGT
ncbi:MAG: PCRF domain-containing protein [bacterium]|nr:PCRF domain-containing protein [bacterium]